jgi:hypothetical protein
MTRYLLAIALGAFLIEKALADEPLPAPETKVVCSASGKFCVTSDFDAQATFLRSKPTGKLLWSVPGWHRWIFVSDDGQTIAIGYDGMNLVPRDVTLSEPIIYIYNNGKLVRTVVLGDFFKCISELTPTVSHYAWGNIQGFNRSNQLVVALVDGTYAAFSAHTGKRELAQPDRDQHSTVR